jgi:hypothetical protein
MINLLPPKEKEIIKSEKIRKIIIILWVLFFSFLLCFSLVLYSVKTYLASQAVVQEQGLINIRGESEIKKVEDFNKEVESANKTMTELSSFFKNKIYFFELVENISSTIPFGIYLSNLSANLSDSGEIKVSLVGFSPTRDLLLNFKENLEKESHLSDIFMPPSNWTKPLNINFSISFSIKP